MNKILFFSDVAHLYKGCYVKVNGWVPVQKLLYVDASLEAIVMCAAYGRSKVPLTLVKPCLKKCSSITDEQVNKLWSFIGLNEDYENADYGSKKEYVLDLFQWKGVPWNIVPKLTSWLLENGFDLFDLIDNGEAIELVDTMAYDIFETTL